MNKVLFLVHGMGVHGQEWAAKVTEQLRTLPAEYGYGWFEENGALADHVDIVPITYDGSFARYLQEWASSSSNLRTYAQAHGIAIPNVLQWLEGASEEEHNFFWSHAVDVLLYRFLTIVAAEVRLRVGRAIAAEVTARMTGGEVIEASVLAHSLGTSVVHDTLALLGSQALDGNSAFLAGNFQFTNLFLVANVSRVLETDPITYKSVVHPTTVNPGAAYCQRYYNFRHRLDPFPVVRAFGPVGWGDNYRAVEDLDRILAFDVHSLEHYLAAPQVHVQIIRGLLGPVISKAELTGAVARYQERPELPCVAALGRFRKAAERLLGLIGSFDDPETLIKAGSQFLALAKEARDECHV